MKRIVVLVSGGGTNLQALLDAQDRGEIPGGQITCVIASKPGVYALERAAAHGIPGKVLERKAYPDVHAYSAAMRTCCWRSRRIWLCMPVPDHSR